LRPPEPSPAIYTRKGSELPLSATSLAVLLRAVLDKGKPFRFCARGYSMSPFVQDGDLVTVAPWSGDAPRMGDVVACLRPDTGTLVVHRVIGQVGDGYLIQGDNTHWADGVVPRANLLGRVVRVERGGQPVRLGLGPERFVISLLNRMRFLPVLLSLWRRARGTVKESPQ